MDSMWEAEEEEQKDPDESKFAKEATGEDLDLERLPIEALPL